MMQKCYNPTLGLKKNCHIFVYPYRVKYTCTTAPCWPRELSQCTYQPYHTNLSLIYTQEVVHFSIFSCFSHFSLTLKTQQLQSFLRSS